MSLYLTHHWQTKRDNTEVHEIVLRDNTCSDIDEMRISGIGGTKEEALYDLRGKLHKAWEPKTKWLIEMNDIYAAIASNKTIACEEIDEWTAYDFNYNE